MTSRLRVEKVCKTYAAPVLRDVNLTIGEGEIHALLGANGAGKSTLSRIIAGLLMPTSGSMSIDGRRFAPKNKFDAEQQSVQIVQQPRLVDSRGIVKNPPRRPLCQRNLNASDGPSVASSSRMPST